MNMMQHVRQTAKNNKGFTLIELMIVVAIIGILAAIAVPQFSSYRAKGYIASCVSDAKNAHTAVIAYCGDHPNDTAPADEINPTKAATTYTSIKASAGNKIVIDEAAGPGVPGQITVSNEANLTGTLVLDADGNVDSNTLAKK
ncbi:MAG: type IV pilin protein [Desulfobulbus sp.]|jgi:type IV pilus assembly protein PilA